MLIEDITGTDPVRELTEARMTWARTGNKIVRKYRCTTGPRKGRVVSSPDQCSKPIDVKKRIQFKQTKAKQGAKMKRKSARTRRVNPASRRLKNLNK
jgi:hypothetical protein